VLRNGRGFEPITITWPDYARVYPSLETTDEHEEWTSILSSEKRVFFKAEVSAAEQGLSPVAVQQ
jgi:hypothetical protein